MMSADPMVPDPLNGQAWNRYSYVINNPLALTDPNGYDFLSDIGHAISTFFGRTFGVLFRDVPILGSLFQIAAVGLCAVFTGFNPACALVASASSAFVTGVTSGSLGAALKAGLIAGASALAIVGVSEFAATFGGDTSAIVNVAGRALVGCARDIASGSGSCQSGALAGGVSAALAPVINTVSQGNFGLGVTLRAVAGGVGSVIGGGKFGNGAVTGAFGYLFSPQVQQSVQASSSGSQAGGPPDAVPSDAYGCGPCVVAAPVVVGGAAVSDALFGTAAMATVFGWLGAALATDTTSTTPPLYHGTDSDSANTIVSNGLNLSAAKQAGGGDYFWSTTDIEVARWFALANPKDGPPAVVQITVPEQVLNGLQASGQLLVSGNVHQFAPSAWPTLNRTATFTRVE